MSANFYKHKYFSFTVDQRRRISRTIYLDVGIGFTTLCIINNSRERHFLDKSPL